MEREYRLAVRRAPTEMRFSKMLVACPHQLSVRCPLQYVLLYKIERRHKSLYQFVFRHYDVMDLILNHEFGDFAHRGSGTDFDRLVRTNLPCVRCLGVFPRRAEMKQI